MRTRLLALLLATTGLFTPAAVSAQNASCQFVLGFATLAREVSQVGQCMDDQSFAANGDAVQHTTGGLLVWRKADNWTAFTDGYRTWVNGPNGIQERLNTERFSWESDGAATAPSSLAEAADQVRACMTQHNLPTAHAVLTPAPPNLIDSSAQPIWESHVFAQCDWPPPPYAAQDGYSQTVMESVNGPGQDAASGVNVADRFFTDCHQLALQYSFGLQGASSHWPPFSVTPNTIDAGFPVRAWSGDMGFYPKPGEIDILHNTHNRLDIASCAA